MLLEELSLWKHCVIGDFAGYCGTALQRTPDAICALGIPASHP